MIGYKEKKEVVGSPRPGVFGNRGGGGRGVFLIWGALFLAPLLFYPWAVSSPWVSSPDIHSTVELFAALAAFSAAASILIHFFATGRRFFLIISLGFTLQGTEDFVHALFAFTRIRGQIPGIENFVPGTYVAGRLTLVIFLFIALLVKNQIVPQGERKKESLLYLVSGFLASALLTALIINSPLPTLILKGYISRPADLFAASLYLIAFFLYLRVYREPEHHTLFVFSMIASIIFGCVSGIYMIHSQQLFDAQFDISHLVKVLSYFFPVFGIAIGTLYMFHEVNTMQQELKERVIESHGFIEKEKRLNEEVEKKMATVKEKEEVSRATRKAMLNLVEDIELQKGSLVELYDKLQSSQFQLVQAEKLSGLGQLAAGVAHELNNPLMGIVNYIQYCLNKTEQEDPRFWILQKAEVETRRCTKIVENLLTFSRIDQMGAGGERTLTNCFEIIELVISLISYKVEKAGVTIIKEYEDDVPDIWVRRESIQQVLLNIITNAVDAVEGLPRKEVRIGVEKNGKFLKMSVTDSGEGIGPENLGKVFDPFFTTKPVGKGTGLGLPVCLSIAKGHGGELR